MSPQPSVLRKAYTGIAWSTGSGGIQLIISLTTFSLVASRLLPAEIGAFGIAAMMVGLCEILTTRPFGESLQQRKSIRRAHLNATFWIILILAVAGSLAIALASNQIGMVFSSSLAGPLLAVMVAFVPLSSISTVNDALLIRRLKFDTLARAGTIGTCLAGLTAITAILLGAGVWSLVFSDIVGRLYRLVHLWWAAGYVPGPIRDLKAGRDLLKFNINTVLTYVLGFADQAAPRALTGLLLGPAALGYLIIGQKFMALLSSLVLSPISSVTMASIARVQDNREELQRMVLSLYRIAAIVGYPAFLGAALVVPDLAQLFGDKWVPAILVAQLLLLRGIRLTTGVFNVSILRGVGHSGVPLILLSLGLVLNLALVPIGAAWGIVGVAWAMLARTMLTWPIGLVLVKRAVDISVMRQILVGTTYLVAALAMALIVMLAQRIMPVTDHMTRAIGAAAIGAITYIAICFTVQRQDLIPAARMLLAGNRKGAFRRVRQAFSL